MAASSTDKFKYLARKWVGQIGSGGVADGSVTTIPLASTTNLPTATGITVVIDRVDSNGTKTPLLEETVTGVVSGSNLISVVRGVEGTAGAHGAGSVVEVLFTAADWQSVMDGILVEHGQDGTHAATIVKTTSTQTLTNKTLTSPKVNENVALTSTATELNLLHGVSALVTASTTNTFTNKRITKRVTTITSNATPTVNTDNCDVVTITALGAAITSMTTNLTGTPNNFDTLIYRIKDDGTARAISWGASFASRGATLPTTTTLSKVTHVGFLWNSVASTWDCVAATTEA